MRLYTFINEKHEILEQVRSDNYESALEMSMNSEVTRKTGFYSEPI